MMKKHILVTMMVVCTALLAGVVWFFKMQHPTSFSVGQRAYVAGQVRSTDTRTEKIRAVAVLQMQRQKEEGRLQQEQLSDWFRQFEGLSGRGNTRDREDAMRMILQRGDEKEIQRLYGFLLKDDPGKNFSGMGKLGIGALQNGIMDYAVASDVNADRAARVLLEVSNDANRAGVARNYAVQHLDRLYTRVGILEEKVGAQYRERIIKTLEQGVKEVSGDIAGTSLLALYRIRQKQGEGWSLEQLGSEAVRMSLSENSGKLSRSTALELAAQLDCSEVLPVVRNLAEQSPSVAPRICALSVLGRLGRQQDMELVKKSATESYPVNIAAKAALEMMKQRGVIQ